MPLQAGACERGEPCTNSLHADAPTGRCLRAGLALQSKWMNSGLWYLNGKPSSSNELNEKASSPDEETKYRNTKRLLHREGHTGHASLGRLGYYEKKSTKSANSAEWFADNVMMGLQTALIGLQSTFCRNRGIPNWQKLKNDALGCQPALFGRRLIDRYLALCA